MPAPAAKTPASCVKALDLADEGITYAGEALSALSDGLSSGSISGLRKSADKLTETSAKISAITPAYQAAKAECRAAA